MYHHKTKQEAELQIRVNNANLTDADFRNLYWQLWGACSNYPAHWDTFENITTHYLDDKLIKIGAKNEV